MNMHMHLRLLYSNFHANVLLALPPSTYIVVLSNDKTQFQIISFCLASHGDCVYLVSLGDCVYLASLGGGYVCLANPLVFPFF